MPGMAGNLPDDWFRPDSDSAVPALPASDVDTTELAPVQVEPATDPSGLPTVEPPLRRSGKGGRIVGVLAIVGALGLGLLLGDLARSREKTDASSPSPSASTKVGAAYFGPVKQVAPTGVVASCTAPDATDSLGQPVTYQAGLVLDGKLDSAWRCDGDGIGATLTFTLPANTDLVRVAVFNGYGKTDPKSGELMYGQYRRVTSLTWRLPDGSWFDQELADNGSGMQQVELPEKVIGGEVVLTIRTSTAPGWTNTPTRNAVLLSEVQFFVPAK